ncbi:MAG: thiamine phosphate synthase [Lachnospiraceae bacterium]|nr:thiamine phosphate synthase [Lachnospiraceae bacterium]
MIAVTNRHVFDDAPDPEAAFLRQVARVAGFAPKAVVLREKDLSEKDYADLTAKVLGIGEAKAYLARHLVVHNYPEIALALGIPRVHLPLAMLKEIHAAKPDILSRFDVIGTSVHSVEDALEAAGCGATYLFAGNVWETTCKPGLDGRGLQYLREVSASVSIPVYGIGGVSEERMPEVLATGAAGGCMMSGFMTL